MSIDQEMLAPYKMSIVTHEAYFLLGLIQGTKECAKLTRSKDAQLVDALQNIEDRFARLIGAKVDSNETKIENKIPEHDIRKDISRPFGKEDEEEMPF